MVKYRLLMNMKIHKKIAVGVLLSTALLSVEAAQQRVAGSGPGGYSQWATDQYPGFDGLDTLPVPEKKEHGWFKKWLGIGTPKGSTASEQMALAKRFEEEGDCKDAVKAFLQNNPDIAENVEEQVRENMWKLSGTKAPAKVADRPVAVSADDFDDED